jgi:NitT/TauT family transport system permease protein
MKLRRAAKVRMVVLGVGLLLLEIACRAGIIRRFTMIPPSEMVTTLVQLFATGAVTADVRQTLFSVAIALVCAVVFGFAAGALLHAFPQARRTVDPLLATYYSVPVFVFYPLFIVLFGLNAIPKTIIGILYAFVAMIINTLNGLDRVPSVLWKTAKVHHMARAAALRRIVFPFAAPYVFTGVKLAVAYSFIGVIGSEFILSSGGLGYRISFSYNNFQSDVMYALILFVLVVAIAINMALYSWERVLMERRGSR